MVMRVAVVWWGSRYDASGEEKCCVYANVIGCLGAGALWIDNDFECFWKLGALVVRSLERWLNPETAGTGRVPQLLARPNRTAHAVCDQRTVCSAISLAGGRVDRNSILGVGWCHCLAGVLVATANRSRRAYLFFSARSIRFGPDDRRAHLTGTHCRICSAVLLEMEMFFQSSGMTDQRRRLSG